MAGECCNRHAGGKDDQYDERYELPFGQGGLLFATMRSNTACEKCIPARHQAAPGAFGQPAASWLCLRDMNSFAVSTATAASRQ